MILLWCPLFVSCEKATRTFVDFLVETRYLHVAFYQGGTEEQALIGGAVSGILEGVFETFSLSQGHSQADAENLARRGLFSRICESAASGALMGVLFGGEASAESYIRSRLASQGEARMRSGQLPTDAELEAMNLSESEALGQMVLLQMEGANDAGAFSFAENSAVQSYISDPDSKTYSPVEYSGA